jgi:ABC-type nitrate/sulfonate/bicarbonate transport system substrate-binding protein
MAKDAGYRELVSFIDQEWVELQGSIVATEQLMVSDPGLVEKFVRASLKGLLYAREQRLETIAILARFLRTSEQAAAKMYEVVRPAMTPDGTVNEELQRRSFEHVLGRTVLKEPPRLEKIFDYSVAAKVRQELRAKGWKP